jgi:glycosyltransferase involved in cell wall biosynthesis
VRLIQAYHRLIQPIEAAVRLVIVGKPGWGYQAILTEIEERGLQDDVQILSDVDTEELSALYSGALFVAYPSLYEGFGLPVLEAMAYHKPVLTSMNSSMSEVARGAALLVDPEDVESIAAGLNRLASDADLRKNLVRRGDKRRNAYTWPRIARDILDRLQVLAQK